MESTVVYESNEGICSLMFNAFLSYGKFQEIIPIWEERGKWIRTISLCL